MGSIIARGNRLYIKVKDVTGRWVRLGTGFTRDQRVDAEKFIADREREVAQQLAIAGDGPLSLRRYVAAWLDKRTTTTVNDDRTRLERHVLPRIGNMLVVDVRPRHLRDLIMALRADGKLAPKTIRQISGLIHSVFKSAIIDEIVTENPAVYERGVLPKKIDKDPTWRHEAIFTRAELVTVLADSRRPADRRILSALKTLAGLRHTEAATLTWAKYDADETPLGAINLGLTKSRIPRRVPVHPTLAALLKDWRDRGWEATYGRAPTPTDMIVPTRKFNQHAAAESQKQFVKDLQKLGLRHRAGVKNNRRGHDLRRTVITLARTDGANDAWLRWITHGPKANEMLDLYSTPTWETLCRELAKLRLDLGPSVVQPSQPAATTTKSERPQRDSNELPRAIGDMGRQDFWLVGLLPPPTIVTWAHETGPRHGPSTCARLAAEQLEGDACMLAAQLMARSLRFELAA